MNHLRRFLHDLLQDDSATTAVEYAVMLALILVVMITAITAVGQEGGGMFGNIQSEMAGHGMGGP